MAGPAKTILVVEDDPHLRSFYRTALTLEGYVVREAGDGLHALHQIDRHPPDLVVLDLDLPNISGVSVRQEIAAHAHTREIPVVVVTGSTRDLAALDVACVLRKPVTLDRLVQSVRSCLTSGGSTLRS